MQLQQNTTSNIKPEEIASSSSILECDPFLTEEGLKAIDAIEATFQHSTSIYKKRRSIPQNDDNNQDIRKTRRQLPTSVLGLCTAPFSLSPCKASVKMRYPALKFGGRILYSRTPADVEKAAMELLQSLEAKRGEMGQVAVGFDIEWRPTFRRGVSPGKAAVMQLCSGTDHCYVMHIVHSGVTKTLQYLLEDSTIVKVGVGIGNDSVKVFKDYNIFTKPVEDLSYLANKKLGRVPKSWSLPSLADHLICKELEKPNKIRLGNWEINVLSNAQLQYAATDAFASWQLYQVLKSLPDAKEEVDLRSEELNAVPQ